MQSKAAQIAALLRGRMVFYVNIETPDGQDSITETSLESPEGITVSAEGDTLTFTVNDKTASFVMLETAQILTNRTEEADIIVTLAQNGGLQIKSNLEIEESIKNNPPSQLLSAIPISPSESGTNSKHPGEN